MATEQKYIDRDDLPGPPRNPNSFDVPPPRTPILGNPAWKAVYTTEDGHAQHTAHLQEPLPHTPSQWEPAEEEEG